MLNDALYVFNVASNIVQADLMSYNISHATDIFLYTFFLLGMWT